jgi:hypothetical protein
MPRSYRALISVPIAADDDDEAEDQAAEFAMSLLHPGSDVIAGHVELVTETRGFLDPKRVVMEDPGLWDQLAVSRDLLTRPYEQDFENTPFSNAEQAQISNQIRQIKTYIEVTYELTGEQIARIDARLDHADQASRRMGRKDWLVMFGGAVSSLILADLITPQIAQHIIVLTIHGLGHIFGIVGGPPYLSPGG